MNSGNFNAAREIDARIGADTLRAVGRAAEEVGAEPYLVGGLARDVMAGYAPSGSPDVDIALVGASGDTFDYIACRVSGEITKVSQFNTAAMRIGDLRLDLAMARSESYPSPGSLPNVRPGTLREDLARRDFSVNAMAISLSGASWGDVFDPEGGLGDLRDGTLRILHPGSFRDDATRILRAARYSSRLSLDLSGGTGEALAESVGYITRISPARIRNELERVILEPEAASALGLLQDWGALAAIHPALGYDAASWARFVDGVGRLSGRERVATGYAIIGCGLSPSDAAGVAARLRPGALGRRALDESAELAELISGDRLAGLSNSALSDLLDPLSEFSALGCALAASDCPAGRRLDEYLRRLRSARPHLSGGDIIALGVPRGPEVGGIQRRLRAARQDGLITSREEEEAFVLDRLKASRLRSS